MFAKKTSTFPLSFRSKKHQQQPEQHHHFGEDHNPPELQNKPSKLFGASVHTDSVEDTARKLTQLRDMGFTDDKHNAIVLKGVHGNLDKCVEALVRLGEGGLGAGAIPSRESSLATSRSMSSLPPTPTTAGLTKVSSFSSTTQSPATSNNPWDISPAPPQSSQSTGTMPNKNPFYGTNPFGLPSPNEVAVNQSMQNLSLAPSTQQLFPHHTGGLPAPPPLQATYQQPMTPPISQSANMTGFPFNTNQTYPQPVPLQQQQQQQAQQHSYNPFMQNLAPPQPQQQSQQSLTVNTGASQIQGAFGNNPFARSPTRLASPLNQIPEQAQQNFYGTPTPQSATASNPFFAMSQSAQQVQQPPLQMQPQMQPQIQPQMQMQPQMQQQTQFIQPFDQGFYQMQQPQQAIAQNQPMFQPSRPDKASIMALYNYPSAAPTPLQQQAQGAVNGMAGQVPAQTVPQATLQRSTTAPVSGTNNPFMKVAGPPAAATYAAVNNGVSLGEARTRESMTLGLEMAWNNGRHSPDAFASLSARGA